MNHDAAAPIRLVKGVGPQRARLLERLGIITVRDALSYLPFRYEDRSSPGKIASLAYDEVTTVTGKVVAAEVVTPNPRRRGLKIFELTVSDESGFLKAKWFNQQFLKKIFKPGQTVVLYGTVKRTYRGAGFEMLNPEYEFLDEEDAGDPGQIHTGRIVPVYRITEGLSQKQLRSIMHTVVQGAAASVADSVPAGIVRRLGLPGLQESLRNVHFPAPSLSLEDLNRGVSPYHQRLAFDELFTLQLGLAAIKKGEVREKGISFSPDGRLTGALRERLPFTLTGAQERVIRDILSDMRSPVPMSRLVQGDVGSGKTIVALIALLAAVESGYQAALMAPTEILAEQHYITMHHLVEELGMKVLLLTGSKRNRKGDVIASDGADIIIGTHALIQEGVVFEKLGLVVIDEQHRFGVLQRATLKKKGLNPDTLLMTATPIPRTMALTLYGDLDYSIIDELPPRRSPVITRHIPEKQKGCLYPLIEDEVKKGRQVYVVYPVIEESEKTTLKDALTGWEAFRMKFPHLTVGLIHGKMKTAEKEEVMHSFKEGRIGLLVSTTVIEVGVDVPNATLMIIIHAERFGLAQLHQLRGRVGRGSSQSHCILLSYGITEDARKRLEVMVMTNDGFRIAEEDLAIRGPGEMFGTRQSGIPDLRIANLIRDARLLEVARREAFSLIEEDSSLRDFPLLRKTLEDFWGKRIEMVKTA
ncbi:MAG: ATP-dependent DNA helicase RecG [Alphaproteobacteria bacterium]|uniref:ATP-dependent DNA helicase RecG n=1 Tax=Candidatus Nitrobium versatile TaxID=2884831 RepID=A0A953JDL8_9BACT|nr:ATP-dependent DNA helicase RecG [Candidatus Nitrobium versatile]